MTKVQYLTIYIDNIPSSSLLPPPHDSPFAYARSWRSRKPIESEARIGGEDSQNGHTKGRHGRRTNTHTHPRHTHTRTNTPTHSSLYNSQEVTVEKNFIF